MRLFLDSSALAKRYADEPGRAVVLARCEEADEVLLSSICLPEIYSLLHRKRREGEISEDQYRFLSRRFLHDCENSTLLDLDQEVLETSIRCHEVAPLRALDSIHVACALVVGCDLFLSADRRQVVAARLLGLETEDPTIPTTV